MLLQLSAMWDQMNNVDYEVFEAPDHLIPDYSFSRFRDSNKVLTSVFNAYDREFMFIISKSATNPDIYKTKPLLFVSNDGGKTMKQHQVMNEGRPVYITKIIASRRFMFCISEINSTFVYIDRYFNEIHMQKYEFMCEIFLHHVYEEYIIKLYPSISTEVRIISETPKYFIFSQKI
ncbi:hypothetical protein RF11_08658 [Thelohanellus kitauei]|uniref:Uncharacterized protein n=1 Tax=Thelohanellus kitauei TaxID=669202 RepID=A0A0C2MY42_THEKT|nr:hypothetical protein RF11_08658 [Thelohanellus kitauei]